MNTRFCYETYYDQSDNRDAISHTVETQSQLRSEGCS